MLASFTPVSGTIFKSRLAKKHLLLILAFSSILTLVGTLFQLFFEYRSDIQYIDAQMDLIKHSHLESLTNSIWTLDDHQIDIQLNNMLSMRDIIYLEITEGDGVVYASQRLSGKTDIVRLFPIVYDQNGTRQKIGVLHAHVSYGNVYQRMLRRIVVILSTQGLKTFLVSLFILFIIHRLVIRYLVKIARYTQGMEFNELGKNLEIHRRPSSKPDELDMLVDAINTMHHRLIQDTARRKISDENLLRYEHIISSTDDLMSFVDKEYRYQSANNAYLKAHAKKRGEIVGVSVEQIMGSEKFNTVVKGYLDRALSGENVRYQSWFDYAGHGRRYMDVAYHPYKDHQNKIKGAVVSAHDLTERKQAEEALQLSLEKFEKTFQTAPIWVVLSNLDTGRYLEVNETIVQTTGYRREEMIGKTSVELNTWVSQEDRKRIVAEVKKKGRVKNVEVQRRTRSGQIIDTLFSAATLPLEGKTVMISVTQDITEQKKAEAERQLLQTQLLQVQKIESVGRLAGGVAHDINNLLSPILGYGEMLLQDTDKSDTHRDAMTEIVNAAKRARDLVHQLLAFSRKQTLEFKSIDLNTMTRNFETLLRRTIREDINIRIRLAPSLPPVLGDNGQLEQVLMNLSVNAQDAMPEGGHLTIETSCAVLDEAYVKKHEGVKPGDYVLLTISDSGSGMDAETFDNIFEPFFTTKQKGQGTGLGLSTVYGIVKQHGGNIWAYSEPGQGATFKIYLPQCALPAENITDSKAAPVELTGTEHILLVEDNSQVRKLAYTLLNRTGYKVLVAKNGADALAKLENYNGPLELVLTDVVMPDMNGKQLFQKVASMHPIVKVLYMSGYSENVISQRGVIDAGTNFLSKPFTIESLSVKVREVLDAEN